MVVIALYLDERRKQKQKYKEIEEEKNFDTLLLEPLLKTTEKNKDLIKT